MNANTTHETDAIHEAPRGRGRPKKATNDRVNEAIKSLKAQRITPTIELVRSLTGGSDSTICKAKRELEDAEATVLASTPLPESLVKALKAYGETSVADVSVKWQQRLDEMRELCMTLEKSAARLEQDNEDLQGEVDQVLRERDQQAGRCALLSEALNTQKQEIAALRTQLAAAELHAGRADDERRTAFDRLQREELGRLRANEQLEQNAEVVASMRVELAATRAHLEHAQQRIKELQSSRAQNPIRELEARSRQQTIKDLQAIPRADIDPAVLSDDDSVPQA